MRTFMRHWLSAGLLVTLSMNSSAHSPGKNARVYFENLKDGDTISMPYELKLGIEGYGIVPAGTRDKRRHTAGHHHLLINHPGKLSMDEPIPHNQYCMHLDKGETKVMLDLPPGKHRLQLLLGDEDHEPTNPPLMSQEITITVK